MIKYYLIPPLLYQENGETNRTVKYLDALKINWSGIYLEAQDMYMVVVNETKDIAKLLDIEKNADVIILDGSTGAKNKVKSKLNINIKATDDEIVAIGKTIAPTFQKNQLWVSE